MQIRTRVASIKISDTTNVKDDMYPANRTQRISIALAAEGHDRLELETGEVFEVGIRSRGKLSPERIAFSLEVHCSSDPADSNYNRMTYFSEVKGEFSSEPLIIANFYLDGETFSDLLLNIRSKLYPTHISLGLAWQIADQNTPLQYGHAPDGSEIIWKNKEKRNGSIELTSLSFFAQPLNQDRSGIEALEAFEQYPEKEPKADQVRNMSPTNTLRLTNILLALILLVLFWHGFLAGGH